MNIKPESINDNHMLHIMKRQWSIYE